MARFSRALVVTLGVVLLAFLITIVPQKNASGAGGAPVVVQNTPLPTTVTNPANNPVLVSNVNDSTDREFFFSLCEADYSIPQDCPAGFNQFRQEFISVFTVPASTPSGLTVTRAVIEYTSGVCRADTTDDIAEVGIEGTFTNNFSFFAPVRTPGAQRLGTPVPGQNSPTTWTWSHTTKIYLPPGASINLLVKSTGIPNEINLQECGGSFWGTLLTQ